MTAEPLHPLDPRRKAASAKPAAKSAGKAARPKPARGGRPAAQAGKRTKPRPRRTDLGPPPGKVRIQKVLAEAGVASRRACEELVLEGRVSVNGRPVKGLPCFVDPEIDEIVLDGQTVRRATGAKTYVLLNKPRGVVCTNADPAGRPRAVDLVADVGVRVFPVGRLDADSTGLILLTNDGELANRISHPRYGLDKTYVAEVDGRLSGEAIEQLKAGMVLDGKRTGGAAVKVLRRSPTQTLVEIRLREGRNREIRRLMAKLGHKVRALRRVAIGPIGDRGIKTGNHRLLTPAEVQKLYKATKQD